MLGIYLRPKMLRGQSACLTEALVSVEDAGIWWAAEETPFSHVSVLTALAAMKPGAGW